MSVKSCEHTSWLASIWRSCGINNGDVVLLHSSASRTLKQLKEKIPELTPSLLLESFLKAVGSEGTLLLPLFNFDFARGVPFDIRSTPSHMGILTESARNFPGAVRTGHPIYSFAAIGSTASIFKNCCNYSGYGSDSPFGILKELNGKIAVLDLPDQGSMTFYHHVEEMEQVSYRYHKEFTGDYTDMAGETLKKTCSLFVRDLEKGVTTCVDGMGEHLWELGLYSGYRPMIGPGLRVISAKPLYEATSRVIRENLAGQLLYRIEK
jgi:aminoglycoside 3-N-acetyltransferase